MKNKKILIIGATGGIGSKLAEDLVDQESNLILAARNQEKLEGFSTKLNSLSFAADISKADSAKSLFEYAKDQFGELDGLVNLAGSILLKPVHLTSVEEWRDVMAQNLDSAFNCLKFGMPLMAKSSSVVLMSSAAGRIGLANHEAISAAKAGVIGLAKSAAATYSSKGIRVNCVAPGLVRTELSQKITSNPASEKASIAMHPLKRLGEPDDIQNIISFLLSDKSSWMTGQVIGVDGGLADLKTI